ncbi:hypothetical protein D3C76_1122430 [compost metagenome]
MDDVHHRADFAEPLEHVGRIDTRVEATLNGVHQRHHVLFGRAGCVLHLRRELCSCLHRHFQLNAKVGGGLAGTAQDALRADALAPKHGHHVLEISGGTGQAVTQAGGQIGDLLEILRHSTGAVHHRHFQLGHRVFCRRECIHDAFERSGDCVGAAEPSGSTCGHTSRHLLGPVELGPSGCQALLLRHQALHAPGLRADGVIGLLNACLQVL